MTDIEDRLLPCFASVFPHLSADEIRNSSVETLAAWDSLTAVTLVAVLQEEFKVEIDPLDLPELITFGAVQEYLQRHGSTRAPGTG